MPLQVRAEVIAPAFYFETLELPRGDEGNHVQVIVQDTFGLLWFGSQAGLHRWDGYHFKTYQHHPTDTTSIGSNYVETMHVAKDGTLWLGLWGAGLDRFDYATETFQHFTIQPDAVNHRASNTILDIAEDADGNLWLATSFGLHHFDVCTQTFQSFFHDPLQPHSLSSNSCRTLWIDKTGTLWVGTGSPWEEDSGGGLHRYRPATEDFVRYQHDPADPNTLVNNNVTELFEDSRGNFWVGTCGDGLHLMDRTTGTFQRLPTSLLGQDHLRSLFINNTHERHISFIFEDRQQKLWIGAWQGGITHYDPVEQQATTFLPDSGHPMSLPEAFPWQLIQAADGSLWGSTAGGLATVFQVKETLFEYYPFRGNSSIDVQALATDGQGKVIMTNAHQPSLLTFDLPDRTQTWLDENGQWQVFGPTTSTETTLSGHPQLENVWQVVPDQDGYLWLNKSRSPGLLRVQQASGQVKPYQHDPQDETSVAGGWVCDILQDQQGTIWATTEHGELSRYHPQEDHFTRYPLLKTAPDTSTSRYTIMAPASNGHLWLASAAHESSRLHLIQFDPVQGVLTEISQQIELDEPFDFAYLHSLAEDDRGNVWIGLDNRLLQIDLATGAVSEILPDYFGLNVFNKVLLDKQNRLWLFEKDVIVFEPSSQNFARFDLTGIKTGKHMGRNAFQDNRGMIYFSAKGGLVRFHPDKVSDIFSDTPKTLISDFNLLYQRQSETGIPPTLPAILATDRIDLSYDQNDFSFHFSTLHFGNRRNNRQQFMLEGYDEQWRPAGLEPEAVYVKVPPGNYTFKVRSTSLHNNWGQEHKVRVYVASPYWATCWAYVFYATLALGLLFTIYRFQLYRKLDKAEAHRLKELDAVKTRLYTNITHEFRTPLTVISGMADQMEENPQEWFREGLIMIKRNSKRLLELVNQMLDLSKLENGKIALQLQQGDITSYVQYLVESVHSLAESKDVAVHFYAEEETIIMDFDAEKIQQVVTNLLTNAVKFTPAGGHIYVSVAALGPDRQEMVTADTNTFLQLKVRDTGPGIPEDQLPYIFDRFYQVDASNTRQSEGSGIGLALVKELVRLMGGTIAVKSKSGQSAEFVVQLPIRREATASNLPLAKNIAQSAFFNGRTAAPTWPPTENPNPAAATPQIKPQILLIEDHADVVAYIAACLHHDYEIQVGRDGQEGIDIALENIPDLIITDVMMPQQDGFAVCHTLKTDERTSHIPIIMLTAKADLESKLEGLEQGADAYLAKPFHKKELQIRIKKLLELRIQLQEYYRATLGVADSDISASNRPEAATPEDRFVQKLTAVVEDHLDDFDFSVAQFCKAIGMSHSQLHRKVTAVTGLSPNKFIRQIRLHKAKVLLRDPTTSVTAVAYETGFSDPGYFGRVFKKEFGATPVEWREQR